MKKREEVYKDLKKKYSDEEIADSFLFSVELEGDEQQQAKEEFLKLRFEHLNAMSEEELVSAKLFAFKLNLLEYFKQDKFDGEFSFAKQLKKYIQISNRSNKDIAENLDIHKTKLSRIVNGKESPNIDLMYRLEEHSGKEIPAFYWWRVYSRELEYSIRTDYLKKKEEADRVENPLKMASA